jgi:arginine N-succinyltransferase
MNPERFLLRPAEPGDLAALERLARASAIGISSLPPDRAQLQARIERSQRSFASEDEPSGEELYLFVLEDLSRDGAIVGTSGIEANPGLQDRFYAYRNEYIVQLSAPLATRNRIHTLHLCHDLTGVSLLTGFYIEPSYADGLAPQLLSRARLLFIAQFAERFSGRIASEHPGVADEQGHCPFWEAVGRRFFGMDYPSAEAAASGRNKRFIADLMPQAPIYVPLLDEPAQWALGQLHPDGELPFSILLDEGFEADTYVNIFDGGPTVVAELASLHSVRRRRPFLLAAGAAADNAVQLWHVIANTGRQDFRASLAMLPRGAERGALDPLIAARLGVAVGAELTVAPLGADPAAAAARGEQP